MVRPDGTGDIADELAAREPHVHVIHRQGPRGYSAASKDGLAWGIAQGFELVATMDADLSHDPAVLPRLVEAVSNGADAAIGSRYTEGGELQVDWGAFRRAVSRSGSAYARLMIGTSTRDCTSGYRCYKAAILGRIPFTEIKSEGYSFLIELLAALRDLGANTVELPIIYVDRRTRLVEDIGCHRSRSAAEDHRARICAIDRSATAGSAQSRLRPDVLLRRNYELVRN